MELHNRDHGSIDWEVVLQSYDTVPVKYYTATQVHQNYEA